jgi:predicted RNA binding protein YcfA (HicA-like mRNA interferase family)
MKPRELIRSLRRLAGRHGWEFDCQEGANHTKVRLRSSRAQIPRHAVDLKAGLFHAILKQLGITPEDLES